jgi:hypothetical protein
MYGSPTQHFVKGIPQKAICEDIFPPKNDILKNMFGTSCNFHKSAEKFFKKKKKKLNPSTP